MMHSRHNLHWWMMMKHMIIKRAKRREKTQPLFHDYLNANVNLWIIMQCSIHIVQGGPTSFYWLNRKTKYHHQWIQFLQLVLFARSIHIDCITMRVDFERRTTQKRIKTKEKRSIALTMTLQGKSSMKFILAQ